jgi:hypothetical protein
MKVEEDMAGSDQWELCLRLMASSRGTFSPVSFLMTSLFHEHDFQAISEAATQGSSEEVVEKMLRQQFANSQNKQLFLFEHFIPAHEKRHFVDFVSTPFGLHLFRTNWAVCASFLTLLGSLAERDQAVTIPLREWAKSNDCPEAVHKFLDDYEFREKERHRLISAGEPTQIPASAVPQRYNVMLTRLEVEDAYRPYVGFLDGEDYNLYPINGLTILEGLAWIVQYVGMTRIDKGVADSWWLKFLDNRQLWMYWALPQLLSEYISLELAQSIKALEWSLMIPAGITDDEPGGDPDELDPAWRFYWLAKHLMEKRTEAQSIEQAVEEVSTAHGWKTVEGVIEQTKHYIERRLSNAQLHPNDPLLSVMYEYVGLMRQSLDARQQGSSLMGFEYIKELPTLPPMTRRVLPDGSMQIRMKEAQTENDEIAARSWVAFAVLSSVISDCVEGDRLVCPFAVRRSATFLLGLGDCTCELKMAECYVSTVMKMVGARFSRCAELR